MSQFRQIKDKLFIGPQPTAQDLDEARQQGIKTVIDLRLPSVTETSNRDLAQSRGLGYVNMPVDKENLSAASIGDLEAAMQEQAGPFLIHCATGARAALLLSLSEAKQKNWSREQAFEHARSLGYDLTTSPAFSNFVAQTVG